MRLRFAVWFVATVVASSVALAQAPPDEAPPADSAPEAAEPPDAPAEEAPSAAASASAAPSASTAPSAPPPAAASAAPASAPPPPAVSPRATLSPTTQPGAPSGDSGPSGEENALPPEQSLGLELDGGFGARVGAASDYGFTSSERSGLVFGPSVWFAPNRLWAVGVAYQRVGLGSDQTEPNLGSISVKRDLDAVWLSGRAFPWRTDSMGVFVALGLGASWQHLHADGTRVAEGSVGSGTAFDCAGSDGPGLALAGGLGLDVDLDRNLAFVTQFEAAGHRHSSETLDACAPGSGSLTLVSGRIGFAYRFDLQESAAGGGRKSARAR